MKILSYLAGASFGAALLFSKTQAANFTPIPLSPGSFNQDVIIEKSATPPPIPVTTASMDDGQANTGASWYEQGFNLDAPNTGLPAAGSTLTSESQPDHTYKFAPSYLAPNAVLIDPLMSNVTVTVTSASPV